jgi:hypothetical protein
MTGARARIEATLNNAPGTRRIVIKLYLLCHGKRMAAFAAILSDCG